MNLFGKDRLYQETEEYHWFSDVNHRAMKDNNVVKEYPSTVDTGETGRRLADRFREHREMPSTEGMTFLYLPTSTKPIIH